MSQQIAVIATDAVPDPGRETCEVQGEMVVVIHAGGQFYVIDDVCTHDGGPLGEGRLDANTIACPRHGAKFDIRTGRALTMPATKATRVFPVEIRDGQVWITLDD